MKIEDDHRETLHKGGDILLETNHRYESKVQHDKPTAFFELTTTTKPTAEKAASTTEEDKLCHEQSADEAPSTMKPVKGCKREPKDGTCHDTSCRQPGTDRFALRGIAASQVFQHLRQPLGEGKGTKDEDKFRGQLKVKPVTRDTTKVDGKVRRGKRSCNAKRLGSIFMMVKARRHKNAAGLEAKGEPKAKNEATNSAFENADETMKESAKFANEVFSNDCSNEKCESCGSGTTIKTLTPSKRCRRSLRAPENRREEVRGEENAGMRSKAKPPHSLACIPLRNIVPWSRKPELQRK